MARQEIKNRTKMILAAVAFLLLVVAFFTMLLIGISPARDEKAIALTQEVLDTTNLSEEPVRLTNEAGPTTVASCTSQRIFKEAK